MTEATTLATPGVTVFQRDARSGLGHTRRMERPQRRAVLPDRTGFAHRGGVRLAYSIYGTNDEGVPGADKARPTVLLLPSWQIINSEFWKLQIGYLARLFRVITFDGRGTGRSSRPDGALAYTDKACAADIVTVMDTTGTDQATLVALSCAATWALHVAADHPDRVNSVLAISPSCGFPVPQEREQYVFDAPVQDATGWATYNKYYWLQDDFPGFVRFFFEQMCSEPHSTKQLEDFLGWAADTDPMTLADATSGRLGLDGAGCVPLEPLCLRVRCPVTAIHGTDDRVRPIGIAERLVELTGGTLIAVDGGGHALPAREPVLINRLIRDVVNAAVGSSPRPMPAMAAEPTAPGQVPATTGRPGTAARPKPLVPRISWVRAAQRARRCLFLSSPIGLGHARRDVAIADQLRRLRPDVGIEWLAQHPVTRVLAAQGERIHPASTALLNESSHIESECAEHDLHAFGAIRRMDEILVNNFMLFSDVVESEYFDLVVADEAWDVDHFLHENPELKRFQFAWLTDFVGWLPMPDADERERTLTADLNAEMLEHRARFGPVRDRSIFVGNPADVVSDQFGPGLPAIDSWVRENYDFAGYITGPDRSDPIDPADLRLRAGCRPGERLCIVTVGGSGVGGHLLRRVLEAVPAIRSRAPDLRFLVVTGPRIDPASLPLTHGAGVVGFLPDLDRYLAACDLAVVQGGLTTCMELTAANKPFIYVPLRHHFEQNIHVRRRLDQYGAGRCLPYEQAADPEQLADAVVAALAAPTAYKPVETEGAGRAAEMLADLL